MPLAAGSNLSTYEILAPLGSGAMGEVWRARDTRLGREVAIKVLPEHFVDDEERLRRFEREARTLASLNHPNVAQIFGVDQVGDTCFLVLELVPGETLEERVGRGALPLEESLEVCSQIADGLEAAHEAGVVHRDLKPANVRITPEGRVKVLDFGLAKPMRAREGGAGTDSVLSTEAGRLLGTPTYMAPEQARGKPVDKRVDVWALGCVLYECLTGGRAFPGGSLPDVVAAVLEKEPDWTRLPARLPPRLVELLRRCLAKDPRERLRDLGDLRWELARIRAGDAGAAARPPATRRHVPLAAFAAGALLAAAAAFALRDRAGAPASPPVRRFALYGTNLAVDSVQGLAISPDGGLLVYRTRDADEREQLHARALDRVEAEPLAGTEHGSLPFFSPNGAELGFHAQDELRVLTLATGVVRRLAAVEGGFSGGAWLDDGRIVWTVLRDRRIGSIATAGGEPRYDVLESLEPTARVFAPSPLPGGRAVLCGIRNGPAFETAVLDLATRALTVLGPGLTPVLAPNGYVLQQSVDGPLMALPFDLERLAARGPAFPAVADLAPRVSAHARMFALAADGTLAYVPAAAFRGRGAIVSVDRQGRTEPVLEQGHVVDNPRWSRDGRRIAFRTPSPDCDLWILDVERGVTTRLTGDGDHHGNEWLAGDGGLATMRIPALAPPSLLAVGGAGSGEPKELLRVPVIRGSFVSSCAPDGRHVLINAYGGAGADVLLADLSEGICRPLLDSSADERAAVFSPDGRHVAYVSDEEGREEVFVRPFPALDGRVKISIDGGDDPVWSRAGDELFFLSGKSVMVAKVATDGGFSAGRPERLFEARFLQRWNSGTASYDVGPDGDRFLMVRQRTGELGVEVQVVLGWLAELRVLDPELAAR